MAIMYLFFHIFFFSLPPLAAVQTKYIFVSFE